MNNLIYIVKFSGGKDSTAALLKILEDGITPRYTIYQYVTGNTQKEVLDYLNSLVKIIESEFKIDLNFQVIYSEDFIQLIKRQHKPFPNPKTLWCTYWLKIRPLRKWLKENLKGIPEENICFVIGVKKSDSPKRSQIYSKPMIRANQIKTKYKGVALDSGRYWLYFPILELTDNDVWSMLKKYPRIYEKVKWAYKNFINPSSCIVCPFHTKEFYRKAPVEFLKEALRIIEEIEKLPHITFFKLGYEQLQRHKKIILSHLKNQKLPV